MKKNTENIVLSFEAMAMINGGGDRGGACLTGVLGYGITGQVIMGGNPLGFIIGCAAGAAMSCNVF